MVAATAWAVWPLLLSLALAASGSTPGPGAVRCVMYLTGQHDVVPSDADLTADVTHAILAFMPSAVFNADEPPAHWPLFTTVEQARQRFSPQTQVMVAIGGWGDSQGFEEAARDPHTRARWAHQVGVMVARTGADGVDVDWEYPGGNRDDYKRIPNSEREWEIDAFVQLLEALRAALGPGKTLSVAVPALERDLMAFTASTVPRVAQQVDFVNVMTYDMMNRRDGTVKHHSGVEESRQALQRYVDRGAPLSKLNLGLGYYVKWFMTEDCDTRQPLGCPTQLLEDAETGADLGRTGAFSWHDRVPAELAASFGRALDQGAHFDDGSHGYWDEAERRWWSFDTPQAIDTKLARVVDCLGAGGVFAWGLGEDAPAFANLAATVKGVRALRRRRTAGNATRDEL